MNERIKQIALETGFPVIDGEIISSSREECPITTDLEEFAVRLIKECVVFLKDTLDDHFAAEQLEEHFGVEE
jgi:hypothetical protein